MKTVLKALNDKLLTFFGQAQLEAAAKDGSGFLTRVRMVRQLKLAKEARYTNVETRVAFMLIFDSATDKDEEDFLIECMGITRRTVRRWRKDSEGLREGTLKLRTVVIRE